MVLVSILVSFFVFLKCSSSFHPIFWFFSRQYTLLLFSTRAQRGFDGCPPRFHLPHDSLDPPLGVAGRSGKIILQPRLGQTTIARPPHPMRPHQFALRAFNGVALLHFLGKGLGLLFRSARL